MATLRNQTDWSFTRATGVTTQTVTIPATAAGSTLVLVAAGGAQVTAKITNTSGTAFTSRTQALGTLALSIHDFTAVGGETAVFLTLNGAESISGTVYEVTGLGAFQAASNNGTGATPANSGDLQVKPTTAVNLASGSGVLFGAWTTVATAAAIPFNGTNQYRQMGPSGLLRANAGNQPGSNTQFIWATGTADVTSAARWPENGTTAGDYRATSVWLAGGTSFAAQALYANSGAAINPTVNATVRENRIPGTHSTNWYVPTTAVNANIAGYCDKVSYQPGDTVNFKVDSNNGAARVEIYRLGHYGWDTFGARNVLGAQGGYLTVTPTVQGAPSVDGTLGSTSCAWTTNATWTVPTDAAPGVYYVLFRSTVTTTNFAGGHFVVRPSAVTGKVAVVIPDMTHQAYNTWGARTDTTSATTGRNLYRKGDDTPSPNFAHRAYGVCWDRPYATQSIYSNTYLFDSEQPWIAFAEAQGYDLTYLSDWDLDGSTSLLNDAAVVVMLGHHEYWTTGVYDTFTNAVDAGVNMMSVSSNTALWRCRFAAADTAKRTLICYKDSSTRDVSAGWAGTGYDPVLPTGTWRDAGSTNGTANPDRRVEDALTGQVFIASAPSTVAMTVPFASKTRPIWRNSASIQALTTGQTYTTTTNLIGDEVDYPSGGATQPANLVNLSPTSYSTSSAANANGTTYSGSSGTITVGFTLYRRGSGALIFNTGCWRGWEGTSRFARSTNASVVTTPSVDWQNALLAALYDLGAAPATLRGMRPGADTVPTDPATGAPGPTRNAIATAYGLTVPASALNAVFFAAALLSGAVTNAISHGVELTTSNTGIPAGTSLSTSSIGTSSITAGATDTIFSPTSSCNITAQNQTFTRCRFLGGTLLAAAHGNTFINCEFPSGVSFSSSNSNMLTRCRMYTSDDDLSHITGDRGAAPQDQCHDLTFIECMFHDSQPAVGAHADGMQVRGSENLILRRCKLDMGTQVSGNWKNAALFTQNANGGNEDYIVEDCYLNGGGYMMYIDPFIGTATYTGNRFGSDITFGYVNNASNVTPTTWTNNVVHATGVAVPYTTN